MKYNYIIVLCPWKKINGKFPEFLGGEYLGGQTRMDAAVELAKENKETIFILVGGYNEDDDINDSNYYKESQKTSDMKKHMVDNGINGDRIETVESLPCSKHNLVAIFNKYKEEFKDKNLRIGLLTNFYHLPRALCFWHKLVKEEFNDIIENPIPIPAESIIGEQERYIHQHEYIVVLEKELKGIRELIINEYNDGCLKDVRKEYDNFKKEERTKFLESTGKKYIKFRRIIISEQNNLLTCKESKEYYDLINFWRENLNPK